MKKFYFLFLMMLLPLAASADAVQIEGIYYNLNAENKTAEVANNVGYYLSEVAIPESVTYEGQSYSVISIGKEAFCTCSALTSVTIPNSVTSIGDRAFSDCQKLTSVTISNSVISIGGGAFMYCDGLTSLTIGNNVTSIGELAFHDCSALTSVIIPKSVTSIGDKAFDGCSSLNSIVVESGNTVYDSRDNCNAIIETANNSLILGSNMTVIPNSVTSIASGAFHGCSGLTSITIPNSVTYLDELSFISCSSLNSIVVESGNTYYDSRDNCNAIINTARNSLTVGCKTTVIPNSVTYIDNYAFRDCSGLSSITIPNSVTYVGWYAFYNCSGLKSVTSLATTPPQADEKAFQNFDIPLYVPKGTRDAYLAASPWNKFKEIIEIDESSEGETVALDPYVIWCEDNTTFYFLGNGDDISNGSYKGHTVTAMWHGEIVTNSPENPQSNAFKPMPWSKYCSACTKVVFDESFKNVRVTSTSAWFAGFNMQTIEGIEYLNTSEVTSMSYMFACPNLLTLDVSHFDTRKVKYMQDLFGGCNKLETIDLSNFDTSNVVDMAMMFRACNALKTLDLSNLNTSKVTNLTWMFLECYALTTIDFTNFNTSNVITMNNMFQSCSSLTSLDLTGFNTEKVTEMEGVFYDCSSLKTLDVSHFNTSNVTKMSTMFCGCSGLTNLDVSHFNTSKVTSMKSMFGRCSGLTSLDLRNFSTENVTEMSGLVGQCTNLETLDLSSFNTANVTSIDYMFYDCSNLNTIYASDKWSISNVTYEFGMDVFVNCTKLVGGKGTTYKDGYSDFTFAHIDGGSSNPGYFTGKNATPVEEDVDEITIKEIGKTTWCSEYDLDFTNVAGIKAYTATGYDNIDKTIWLTRVMKVPAGTGLLVKGDPGTYKIPHAEVQAYYVNMLVGNLGDQIKIAETDGDKTNYYLSGKDGTFVSVNGSANIGKNKAYLQLPTSVFGGTRSIGISYDDEDGTTSIKNLTPALSEGEGEWYTLQGQRVANPGKGLYIRNGKKVVIK